MEESEGMTVDQLERTELIQDFKQGVGLFVFTRQSLCMGYIMKRHMPMD